MSKMITPILLLIVIFCSQCSKDNASPTQPQIPLSSIGKINEGKWTMVKVTAEGSPYYWHRHQDSINWVLDSIGTFIQNSLADTGFPLEYFVNFNSDTTLQQRDIKYWDKPDVGQSNYFIRDSTLFLLSFNDPENDALRDTFTLHVRKDTLILYHLEGMDVHYSLTAPIIKVDTARVYYSRMYLRK